MTTQLQLTLQPSLNHNIDNPYPRINIMYGEQCVFNGLLHNKQTFTVNISSDNTLVIEHLDKSPSDTTVSSNSEIIADKAVKLCDIHLNDYKIPMTFLYNCEYHVDWDNEKKVISNTLYFGFNGKYIVPILSSVERFMYYVMWEEERSLNLKNQQQAVNNLGEIVETFTRFGEKTDIAESKIPSIDELYKMVCKL